MSSRRGADLRSEILRSAAFRLTLRFAAVFVACLLVADVTFGFAARWVVYQRTMASIDDTLVALRSAFEVDGPTGAAEVLRGRAVHIEDGSLMLGHQDAGGSLLAGSLAVATPSAELGVIVPDGEDPDEGMWLRSLVLEDGGWINVAISMEIYHDIAELMWAGAIWTVVIALPLALLCGALLSRAVLGRLSEIAATTEGVREGSLSHRAPVSVRGDEFDRLSVGLNAMLETIETLTRNLRNVSVGIAHELRGPLTRLRNRLVNIDPSDPDALVPSIESSIAEIDATLVTFDALLKIGQIESRAQGKGFGNVDLSDLLAELAETYAPVAADQGKCLDARIATNVIRRGDRPLLAQMISNLLENAITHTPEGTRIKIELDAVGTGHRLVVQDDGPGIPPTDTERVFDRFYRPDGSASKSGTGLGLSLVRSICGLHGFVVRLMPGISGARFEISM